MLSLNDIGKVQHKIGHSMLVSLTCLTILPLSAAYIDCRISCRRCHENTEHPSVLEVYCAMCDECKQRRREKLLGRSGSSLPTEIFPPKDAEVNSPGVSLPDVGAATEGSSKYPETTKEIKATFREVTPSSLTMMTGRSRHVSKGRARIMRDAYDDEEQQPQPPVQQQPIQQPAQPSGLPQQPVQPNLQQINYGLPPMLVAPGPIFGYPAGCPSPPDCSETEEELVAEEMPTSPLTSTITTTQATTTPFKCPEVHCKKKKKRHHPPIMPMMPMMMPCMPCMAPCASACPMHASPTTTTTKSTTVTTKIEYQYVYIGVPRNSGLMR